ncbi:MAG: alpha/beta hydrolase [Idiomarina sp.]|uniref:YqiA/YcfP family alpha/beta fold hydrolase n=1 Tax=Idiomarina sp. TaxID=1874361 RepID=UPI000C5DFE99|nr:YqiA/YcfP family alpha/beta fold hydrolase [Idiomarina sp.]MBT42351.1 alpha/beta hydrolase [Idiomarina sp.]
MHVIFNHGKESGPWGTKIKRLAEVAQKLGCSVESLDYEGEYDADQRVKQLQAHVHGCSSGPLLLVGSSMGGYVATAVAGAIECSGLFVMAPAYYLGGYTNLDNLNLSCPVSIVHGWRDNVVPVENSWRFAQPMNADLHIVNDDHRLVDTLDHTAAIFERFLKDIMAGEQYGRV